MSVSNFERGPNAYSEKLSLLVSFSGVIAAVIGLGVGTVGCDGGSDAGAHAPPQDDAGLIDRGNAVPMDDASQTDAVAPVGEAGPSDGASWEDSAEVDVDALEDAPGDHEADAQDEEASSQGYDGLVCMRDSDDGYVPQPVPPFSPARPGACSQAEIEAHRECLAGTAGAPCPEPPEISEGCHACLLPTVASGAPWGPWEVFPYHSVRINKFGCLENLQPGAGQKEHHYITCMVYLCEPCPRARYQSCMVAAGRKGRCANWEALRNAELDAHPALSACFYEIGSGWLDHALRMAELWCGPQQL